MLKLKILVTTALIGFSVLGKLYIGPVIVLGYFFSDLSLGMALSNSSNIKTLDAMSVSASL